MTLMRTVGFAIAYTAINLIRGFSNLRWLARFLVIYGITSIVINASIYSVFVFFISNFNGTSQLSAICAGISCAALGRSISLRRERKEKEDSLEYMKGIVRK